MDKPKHVKVPEIFLTRLQLLLSALEDYELDNDTRKICSALQSEIDTKYAAMKKRETFTAYKTASVGTDERERLRKNYLDAADVHKDWRSGNEKI